MLLLRLWKGMSIGRPLRPSEFNGNMAAIEQAVNDMLLKAHPVGSLYWREDDTDPATLFGGTWTRIKDVFILAAGDTYAAGGTGGEATVTLTSNQSGIRAHTHPFTPLYNGPHTTGYTNVSMSGTAAAGNAVGANTAEDASEAHNNMPPFETYYCWKRTA